jgi:hypothetical protein
MLGFAPGMAYLGVVDGRIAAPRRGTPRVRVPRGSVGIAGEQTGIYPAETGGWQIIGRTRWRPFDLARPTRFSLKAGDLVSFFAIDRLRFDRLRRRSRRRAENAGRARDQAGTVDNRAGSGPMGVSGAPVSPSQDRWTRVCSGWRTQWPGILLTPRHSRSHSSVRNWCSKTSAGWRSPGRRCGSPWDKGGSSRVARSWSRPERPALRTSRAGNEGGLAVAGGFDTPPVLTAATHLPRKHDGRARGPRAHRRRSSSVRAGTARLAPAAFVQPRVIGDARSGRPSDASRFAGSTG